MKIPPGGGGGGGVVWGDPDQCAQSVKILMPPVAYNMNELWHIHRESLYKMEKLKYYMISEFQISHVKLNELDGGGEDQICPDTANKV